VEAVEAASAAMDPTEADDSDGFPSSGAARRGPVLAGVEGGGTTWVAAVAVGEPDRIVTRADFPTTTPEETLPRIRAWLAAQHAERPFDALGVATFGPVDLDRQSPTYGHITHSPKPGWAAVDVLGELKRGWAPARLPVGFDTDVNAPAVAEFAAVQRELEALDGTERNSSAGAFVRALFEDDGDDASETSQTDDDDDAERRTTRETRPPRETDGAERKRNSFEHTRRAPVPEPGVRHGGHGRGRGRGVRRRARARPVASRGGAHPRLASRLGRARRRARRV
jgi:hypothetical protein